MIRRRGLDASGSEQNTMPLVSEQESAGSTAAENILTSIVTPCGGGLEYLHRSPCES
jgi:hypothetical protein